MLSDAIAGTLTPERSSAGGRGTRANPWCECWRRLRQFGHSQGSRLLLTCCLCQQQSGLPLPCSGAAPHLSLLRLFTQLLPCSPWCAAAPQSKRGVCGPSVWLGPGLWRSGHSQRTASEWAACASASPGCPCPT